MIKLRKYVSADCAVLAALFYDTVHTVNAKDYTKAQLDVWATGQVDMEAWDKSFLEHNTVLAEIDGVIAGFADMDCTGYLDRLYVHKDYQHRGVASALCDRLETEALAASDKISAAGDGSCAASDKISAADNKKADIKNRVFCFTTHASITARPFFEARGYSVIRGQQVERQGIFLRNYVMKKTVGE